MMKFSRAISRVKWFSCEKTNVSKNISVLVLRVFETLVFSPLNHLTRLIARENFITIIMYYFISEHIIHHFILLCPLEASGLLNVFNTVKLVEIWCHVNA
jgi:hypothetical protein